MSKESRPPEQPQPVPLYENHGLRELAENDERLRNLLNGIKLTDERIRQNKDDGNQHLVTVFATTREQIEGDTRHYLNRKGYEWEEQFPEPPEEP